MTALFAWLDSRNDRLTVFPRRAEQRISDYRPDEATRSRHHARRQREFPRFVCRRLFAYRRSPIPALDSPARDLTVCRLRGSWRDKCPSSHVSVDEVPGQLRQQDQQHETGEPIERLEKTPALFISSPMKLKTMQAPARIATTIKRPMFADSTGIITTRFVSTQSL